ncbi:hypothetical protein ScPMuIL_010101 [Solemya velum]
MDENNETFRSPFGTCIKNKMLDSSESENRNTTNSNFITSTPNTTGKVSSVLPRRKSGRRSWFEESRNHGTKIEIAFETPVKKIIETEEVETLLLTHFTNPPRVEFGKVRVGKSKSRTISVKNPHDDPQSVRVEKVPHKKKFSVDARDFVVQPHESVSLKVTWAPEEVGNCREMILFHIDDAYRLQAFVFGMADPIPKKRKQGKGLMGRSAKKPFSVIKTQSLANIQRSYSPVKNVDADCSFEIVARESPSVKLSAGITALGRENERPSCDTCTPETVRPTLRRRSNTYTRNDSWEKCSVKPETIPAIGDNGSENKPSHENAESLPISCENTTSQKANISVDEIVDAGSGNSQSICANNSKSSILGVPVAELSPIKTDNIEPSSGQFQDSFCVYEFAADRLSPNSFLHESLLYQKRNSTCLADLNRAYKTPRKSMQHEGECIKVVNSKGFLSPETFLKDLSVNKSGVCMGKEQIFGDVLSPQSLLNNSIPHEIVVTQLKSIKTRLSDHGLNQVLKKHKKRKSNGKQVAKKEETEIMGSKSNRNNRPIEQKLRKQIPQEMTNGSTARRSSTLGKKNVRSQTGINTTHIVGKKMHKESTVISRVQVKSGLVSRKRRSLQQNTEKVNSTKGRKIETSASQNTQDVVSVAREYTTFVTHESQKISIVEEHSHILSADIMDVLKTDNTKPTISDSQFSQQQLGKEAVGDKLQETFGIDSHSHQRETIRDSECMLVYGESTTVTTETHRQTGLTSKFSNCGSATVTKSYPTCFQSRHESSVARTCTDSAKDSPVEELVQNRSLIGKKYASTQYAVNKPLFPFISATEYVDVAMDDQILGVLPLPTSPSEESVTKTIFSEKPESVSNESSPYANSCSPFSDHKLGFENLLSSTKNWDIDDKIGELPTGQNSQVSHRATFLVDASFSLPGPGIGVKDASLGTPELLPTSPNPDMSRRSTHIVAQPKVLDLSHVGRKKLFQSPGNDSDDIQKNRTPPDSSISESQFSTCIVDDVKSHVPTVGTMHACFGTPDLLPTSPLPDTSRRSTHIIVQPKVIDISHLRKKKLFQSVEDGPILLDTTGESNASMSASLATDLDSDISSARPRGDSYERSHTQTVGTDNTSLGTPEVLPNSPNPDTSRRSTHTVFQPKIVHVSNVDRKALFRSNGETVTNDTELLAYGEGEACTTPGVHVPVQQLPSNKWESSSSVLDGNVKKIEESVETAASIGETVTSNTKQLTCEEEKSYTTPGVHVPLQQTPNKCESSSSVLDGNVKKNEESVESIEEPVTSRTKLLTCEEGKSYTTPEVHLPLQQPSSNKCESSSSVLDGNVKKNAESVESIGETVTSETKLLTCEEGKSYTTPGVHDPLQQPASNKCESSLSIMNGNVKKIEESVQFPEENSANLNPPECMVNDNDCKTKCTEMTYMCSPPAARRGLDTRKRAREESSGRKEVLSKQKNEQIQKRQKYETRQRLTMRQQPPTCIQGSGTNPTNRKLPKPPARTRGPLKGLAQSKLILVKKSKSALPKHPLPFAAKNMYYDERWLEKQERGFVNWLNFILTPAEEYQNNNTKVKVDAGKICMNSTEYNVNLAPTKEILSFRAYAVYRRLNHLRRSACQLFQSEPVVRIIHKVEAEVESLRVAVRKDRMLHADLGIKQNLLDLLMSYNPLWLRIGVETIFGEVVPLQSNNDVFGLSHFILTRLLCNPDIQQQYAHPTVPHLYSDGYGMAMSKHILKKFLLLVYFLDRAKTNRIICHDPCLFCKDSDVKSSKEVLYQFSRDYLSGEGDIIKHLGYFGYKVSYVQRALEEFDYAVTNLAVDLRDGLRIVRTFELLDNTSQLTKKLRVPAISRLQKIHNVDVIFTILKERSINLDYRGGIELSARDVVDGHREKTLALLWKIVLGYQVMFI